MAWAKAGSRCRTFGGKFGLSERSWLSTERLTSRLLQDRVSCRRSELRLLFGHPGKRRKLDLQCQLKGDD